jgi:type II secretory ATPase GspE/PulE/Tfp pilus assembly ATPase PilB-like protein
LRIAGNCLAVAHCNYDSDAAERLAFFTNREIELIEVSSDCLIAAINFHYGDTELEFVDCTTFCESEDRSIFDLDEYLDAIDGPAARLFELILSEAIAREATSVHIEPLPNRFRIRYCIDGEFIDQDSPPRRLASRVLRHLTHLAGIDVAGVRQLDRDAPPQHLVSHVIAHLKHLAGMATAGVCLRERGLFSFRLGERIHRIDVSLVPTSYGDSAIIRFSHDPE